MEDENLTGRKGNILRIRQKDYERARKIKRHQGMASENKSETKRARESNRNQEKKIKTMSKYKTIFEQTENAQI
jgi:hypothetical protein